MIEVKTKLRTFKLKTGFEDLTFDEYKELLSPETTEFRQVNILTGLNEMEAQVIDLEPLSKYLGFLKESPFDTIEPSDFLKIEGKDIILPEDIAEHSWAQKIFSFGAIPNPDEENQEEFDPVKILSPYVQPLLFGGKKKKFNIEKLEETERILRRIPMSDLFSGINYIRDQIVDLAKRERDLLRSEVTFEQKRAGIDMFNQLGDFNTIDLVAQGKPWKYERVLKIDYNTILNKLFKLNLTSKFERNYQEVIKDANK